MTCKILETGKGVLEAQRCGPINCQIATMVVSLYCEQWSFSLDIQEDYYLAIV